MFTLSSLVPESQAIAPFWNKSIKSMGRVVLLTSHITLFSACNLWEWFQSWKRREKQGFVQSRQTYTWKGSCCSKLWTAQERAPKHEAEYWTHVLTSSSTATSKLPCCDQLIKSSKALESKAFGLGNGPVSSLKSGHLDWKWGYFRGNYKVVYDRDKVKNKFTKLESTCAKILIIVHHKQ